MLEKDKKILEQRLLCPFIPDDMEVRPGATDKDKKKAQPLFYVSARAVDKRLRDIFGIGGYSVSNINVNTAFDTREKTDWTTKAVTKSEGVLVATTCSIKVHTEDLNFEVSNVGEKGLDETGHNKVTSSFAQAYKRAASLLGIGSYLYYMKNIPMQPYDSYSKKITGMDFTSDKMNELTTEALKDAGFHFKCEETGDEVSWLVAAKSMEKFGRILSIAIVKKLQGK